MHNIFIFLVLFFTYRVTCTTDVDCSTINAAMNQAVQMWEGTGMVVLRQTSNGEVLVRYDSPFEVWPVLTPAMYDPASTDIHLNPEYVGKVDLATVLAHELGHALGLKHSKQSGTLMFPVYEGPKQLSEEDIAALYSIVVAPH